ncbi:MAG: response regulator [Enhydrobacter sp.]|nr:MAG: response regulator [Enhydrobacter sp.]
MIKEVPHPDRLKAPLARRAAARVLIVEDDALAAEALQMNLEDAGYGTVAPAESVQAALTSLERHAVDAALLDIHLRGELVFPVADELAARGVPFVFVTSQRRSTIPSRHRDRPVVAKPFQDQELLSGLAQALGSG